MPATPSLRIRWLTIPNDKTPPPSDAIGATVGQLPCIPIASSVTSYGRDLLFQTKAFVEKHYTIENGFPYNAEVRLDLYVRALV